MCPGPPPFTDTNSPLRKRGIYRHRWATPMEESVRKSPPASSDKIQRATTAVRTDRWREHAEPRETVRDNTDGYTHTHTHTGNTGHSNFTDSHFYRTTLSLVMWQIRENWNILTCPLIVSVVERKPEQRVIAEENYVITSCFTSVEHENHRSIQPTVTSVSWVLNTFYLSV